MAGNLQHVRDEVEALQRDERRKLEDAKQAGLEKIRTEVSYTPVPLEPTLQPTLRL